MPIIIEWTFKDGSKEIERIPAQVWRHNEQKVVKTFMKDKEVASIKLDPYRETADIDESNNSWNTIAEPSHILFCLKIELMGLKKNKRNNSRLIIPFIIPFISICFPEVKYTYTKYSATIIVVIAKIK